MIQKIKIIALAVLVLLAVIIVLQNKEQVETKLLFVSLMMPRAALLFGTMVTGFALGILTAGRLMRRAKKESDGES
ncbi:MAG: LapA family protein [Planctomycetes bacterium]|nr:LapA family protein [Planctomycetota bacterium]MBL7043463.1 LapA family protein [Pirellulaceae bacterium]